MLVVSEEVGDLHERLVQFPGVGLQGVAGVVLHHSNTAGKSQTHVDITTRHVHQNDK